MKIKQSPGICALLLACVAPVVCSQTVDPFYSGTYSLINLGSVAGVPTNYGGLIFKAGDPNTILLGGSANNSGGLFYSVAVTRGAGNHIVALGPATALGFGINNDGGIAYGPGGVLFYSEYIVNNVGPFPPVTTVRASSSRYRRPRHRRLLLFDLRRLESGDRSAGV
jgi:hypothetical protein